MNATTENSDATSLGVLEGVEEEIALAPVLRVTRGERRETRHEPRDGVGAGERAAPERPAAAAGRMEACLGAALSLLRRCIVEGKTPTREALAAEAGFALGLSRDAALAELDEIAQLVGVSSLR